MNTALLTQVEIGSERMESDRRIYSRRPTWLSARMSSDDHFFGGVLINFRGRISQWRNWRADHARLESVRSMGTFL